MQRKELEKAIKEFSHKANFYELGLVRKLLKYREKTKKELMNNIPKIICPNCCSSEISQEHDDNEYSCDAWFVCNNCGKEVEDTVGLIEATQAIDNLCWSYTVDVTLHFENPNIKTLEWKNRCRKLILEELNDK